MDTSYKKAKALYQEGLYSKTLEVIAANHPIKSIPFREGQRLRIDTTSGSVEGRYIGTIKDALLIESDHQPIQVPFTDVREICVFW